MLEHYLEKTLAEGLRSGELGRYLDSFAAGLAETGYARSTAQTQLRLLADLGEWLRRRRRTVADLDRHTVEAFVATRRRGGRLRRGDRWTVGRFVEHLQRQGIAGLCTVTSPDEPPLLKLERRYEAHLHKERGLNAVTVKGYRPFVHRFLLERFGEERVALRELQPSDVSSFIAKQADSLSPRRAQLMTTALRSLLRFLVREGETQTDLAACVPTVPCWQQATVPKYLRKEEVERLLASCDRSTPTGRRDYALLLLLARLGLRAGEVVALQLEDIDWRSGEIRVLGKGQLRDRLPLLPDLGEALVAYLRQDRPRTTSRRVFICAKAPRCGFAGPSSVSTIVRRALTRAKLQPPLKGAHLLRHSLATGLLHAGASMAEIAEVLRHRAPATTEIYAKVDIRSLRTLAQPWPTIRGAR